MPFDPTAPSMVVDEPAGQAGFDPSQPSEIVEESPSFQPAIQPPPGPEPTPIARLTAPVSKLDAFSEARAPLSQAFPTGVAEREAATKEPSLTMEEAEQMLMTPNITIPNPIPESWPRTRGVVNVLKTIPEMATSGAGPLILGAQLVPGLREPVDAVLGASMLKAGSQMAGEASVTKDKEKMAEAITTAGLGALALGGTLARPQVAPAIANEVAARRVGRPDITAADLAARRASGVRDAAGLPVEPAPVPAVTPGTLLKRADAELKELTGERTTDAVPKRETEALPVEEPPRGGTQVGAQVREQTRPDDAPAKEATSETQRDVGKPAGITQEAADLISSGGVPAIMTRNLERIARENGIEVTQATTPNEVINGLRQKAQAAVAEQPSVELAAAQESPTVSSEPIGGKEVPKPAEPTPAPARKRGVERPWDIIDEIKENIGTIRIKKFARPGSEGYYTPEFMALSRSGASRELFASSGQGPDQVLDTLRRKKFLGENATVDDLRIAIERANAQRRAIYKGETPEIQADKFYTAIQKEGAKKGSHQISVGDLSVGDKFRIGGEEMEVVSINPDTGEVTVKDGRKFGHQTIPDGADIAIEKGSFESKPQVAQFTEEDFALAVPESVEQQKARLAHEEAVAKQKAEQQKMEEEAAKPLIGTRGDIGQREMFGGGDLFSGGKPEMVGMGGAVPSEFAPKGQTATGIKNAAIEADRLARGEEPLFSKARESNQATWERTMAQIDRDPGWQDRLIAELKETPRNISDIEEVALMHRLTDLKNEYAKATRDAEQAYSDGRPQDVAQAQERIADWQSKLAELERVARDVGTEWGKSGQMRQRLMREDFTLEAMERQFREAKGFEPLTESERAQVKRQHDELQAKIKALEERVGQKERQLTDAETARVMAELKAQAAEQPKYEPRVLKVAEDFASFMDEKAASALSRIKEKLRQVGAAPDPTLLADVAIYGAAKITRGLVDFAKWSDEMVREVGDWIKPHLDQAWKDSQKLFQADLDRFAKPLGKMAADIKKAVTDGAKAKPIEKITAQIKVKAEANDLAGVGILAKRLAREFVIEGIREWKPLVEAVHAKIKEVIPEFTLSQARDAISGYGDYTQLTKDEISVILRDLKGQMQQHGKLEDMAAGRAPKKTGMERRTPSDEERRLIKQVNEAKKKGGFKVTDPATQLRTALQAIKTRLENQIKDLSFQITNKTKMIKERRSVAYDSEAQALKRKRDELKEQYDAMFPKEPITDAQRLANWKTRAQKRIKELNERIANKDFEPRKRKPIELDKEAFKIELQIEEIKRKFNDELVNERMARRDRWSKIFGGAAEGINTTRSLLTSADVSAVLRQGGFIAFGHPLRAAKSVPEMLKALVSKEAAAAVEAKIRLRDNYQLYRQSGLELTEQGHSLVKMEEAFMSRLAGKLPFGVGKLVEGSQRAYTTFLNLIRADSFDAMVRTLSRDGRTVTPVEAKIIANFVNVATGRGQIGAKANMAAGLNTVFFAPRFVASRFQLALGQPIWHGIASGGKIPFKDTAKVRRMIAKEYARFLAGAGFVYALGSVLGGEIEIDPRSSDFAKLKFGNTRIDLLGGLQQVSVFTSRSIFGSTKTGGGRVLPIRGELPYGAKSWADVAGRFARTKFSPVFGTMVDIMTGKNVVEEPTTVGSVVQRLTIPISFQEVGTLMEEQGFPKGFSMFLLSLFGAGVQTYEER